jgi:hypothetical protein
MIDTVFYLVERIHLYRRVWRALRNGFTCTVLLPVEEQLEPVVSFHDKVTGEAVLLPCVTVTKAIP